jgi:hypothetical protein
MSGRARWGLLGAVMATAWVLSGVATPVAGQQSDTTCTAEADFTVSPGLSTSGSSGSFTTDGDTGTFDCKGQGKGTLGFSGKYGTKDPDSCSSGGEGTASNSFKFSDGGGEVTDEVEILYGPFQGGVIGGSFKGARTSGTFEVTPIEGDCVTKPITKAHASFKNIVVKR